MCVLGGGGGVLTPRDPTLPIMAPHSDYYMIIAGTIAFWGELLLADPHKVERGVRTLTDANACSAIVGG